MLSFLNAIVDVVDVQGKQVVFRSNRNYSPGKKVTVQLAVPPGSGHLKKLEVVIKSSRELDHGGFAYIAEFIGDPPDLDSSSVAVTERVAGLRRSPRYEVGVRVRSRQLPGFQAITVDLSQTGVQLETEGEVAKGTVLEMVIEFGRYNLPDLTASARVVWCRPLNRKRFRAGCLFVSEENEVRQRLEQLSSFFEERSSSDLYSLLEEAKVLPEDIAPVGRPRPGTAPPPEARPARDTPPPITIPIEATMVGYSWAQEGPELTVTLRAGDGGVSALAFPNCQTVRDHLCSVGAVARTLVANNASELIDRLVRRGLTGAWKHYQFMDADQNVILEVVSKPCRVP